MRLPISLSAAVAGNTRRNYRRRGAFDRRDRPTTGAAGAAAPAAAAVVFYGAPTAAISSRVLIPGGRASIWVSGTTPPVLKADAPAGSRDRFGDTRTQAAGILRTSETQLKDHGLTMKDIVYLRAYLVPDTSSASGSIDVAGWNAAYGAVFGTADKPDQDRAVHGRRDRAGQSRLADRGRGVCCVSVRKPERPRYRTAPRASARRDRRRARSRRGNAPP